MLTLRQSEIIEAFANDLIEKIRYVIVHKPIKRISKRKVNGKYVNKQFEAPVNSSGELARTLRYELTDTHLSIMANDYIYELIFGKKPTISAMDNDINLESKIRKWMDYKGIGEAETGNIMGENVSIDGDKDTIAYHITNKIQKFGSSIYLAHHGNDSGLLQNIVSDEMIREYNKRFRLQLETEFKELFADGN